MPATPGYATSRAEDPFAGMTPAVPGAPAFNPGGGSPFMASINAQRANEANRAATFAAASPLPATDAASAYGNVATSQAARAAYVGDQKAVANQNSGNYFQNAGFANDANARSNAQSGAQTGYLNAMTRGADADTTTVTPQRAAILAANAAQINGQTRREDLNLPYEQDRMAAGTAGIDADTLAKNTTTPYIVKHNEMDLDRSRAELNRYNQMTTPLVLGARDAAADTDAMFKRQQEMLRMEEQLNRRKFEGQGPPPLDPVQQFELDEKKKKAARDEREAQAKEIGERVYNSQGFWAKHALAYGKSRERLIDEARQSLPVQAAQPPEMTITGPGGVQMVLRNGKWVNKV